MSLPAHAEEGLSLAKHVLGDAAGGVEGACLEAA
jgi:hypothetical protein